MARWYAKFDGGSVSTLDSLSGAAGYFEKLRVGASSASAALLRDGLIASRSAVSNDVYDDLDAANRDGSKGTYFPPDISTLPTATLISWSTAYSSSVDGIKFPTTNTYGVSDSLNYSLRPTGSVVSTQPTLAGPTTPRDPVQLNYNVYLSASQAVKTVIDTFQTASTATVLTPYTRQGQNPSRTLHSIWHNPTLDYFAWDDFTPGQVQSFTAEPRANGVGVFTIDFNAGSVTNGLMAEASVDSVFIRFDWLNQYRADLAGDSILNATATPNGGSARTLTGYNPGQGILQYDWDLGNTVDLMSDTAPGRELTLNTADVRFEDAIIPTHTGIEATISSGVVATVLRVYQKSIKFVASGGGIGSNYFCTNNVTAGTYYSNAGGDQYTLAVGAYRVFTSKTSGASLGAGYYVGGNVPNNPASYTWWESDGGDINNTGTETC
jgi:hypothetical protein